MKVEYAPRAVGDLARIGSRRRRKFGNAVAAALEIYIRATVARIASSGRSLFPKPAEVTSPVWLRRLRVKD
jgi:hypothetical protein